MLEHRRWSWRKAPHRPDGDGSAEARRPSGESRALAGLRGAAVLELLDSCPDSVIVLDAHARVLCVNAMARQSFGGAGTRQLIGTVVDELVPQLKRMVNSARLRHLDGDHLTGPAGRAVELTGVRADGSRFPVSVWLAALRSGQQVLLAATIRDLTAQREADARSRRLAADLTRSRQQLLAAREELAAVLRAVGERVIIVADAHGTITAFNRGAERLLGYSSAHIVGQPTTCLSDPQELSAVAEELGIEPGVDPLLELTRSGLPNTQDWSYVSSAGERRPVTLKITAVGDRSDPSGFVCVAEDRTFAWTPATGNTATGAPAQGSANDRLLLDLDDAETRSLRWQVGGGSRYARRG